MNHPETPGGSINVFSGTLLREEREVLSYESPGGLSFYERLAGFCFNLVFEFEFLHFIFYISEVWKFGPISLNLNLKPHVYSLSPRQTREINLYPIPVCLSASLALSYSAIYSPSIDI